MLLSIGILRQEGPKTMNLPTTRVYPLLLVLSAICIVEATITMLYGQLSSAWERIPVLVVILFIPIAVVSTFVYLWLRRPGYLYPPSEFGDTNLESKFGAYQCEWTRDRLWQTQRADSNKKRAELLKAWAEVLYSLHLNSEDDGPEHAKAGQRMRRALDLISEESAKDTTKPQKAPEEAPSKGTAKDTKRKD